MIGAHYRSTISCFPFCDSPEPYRLASDVCSVASPKRAIEGDGKANGREHRDWLRRRTRATYVSAREEEGQRMRDQRFPKSSQTTSRKLASLESSPIKVLKEQWREVYGSEPPHRISRELLIRAIAYRIQEQARGGLKPSTRRFLVRLGSDARGGQPMKFEP